VDIRKKENLMFVGFDEKDGAALYDSKEAAIERAKMLLEWDDDPDAKIMVHRKWVPLWIAHLFMETKLEWIGYSELSK
jgi:hypothetical protein